MIHPQTREQSRRIVTLHILDGFIDDDGEPCGTITFHSDCRLDQARDYAEAIADNLHPEWHGHKVIACNYRGDVVALVEVPKCAYLRSSHEA